MGRLRVGAAIGATGDFMDRAAALAKAGVDVLVIDTAHGHSTRVIDGGETAETAEFPDVDLIAGNVATAEGARRPHTRRSRCRKSGHGARIHLHHPGRDRRRSSPDHRNHGLLPGSPVVPASRSSPTAESSFPAI